MIHKQDISLENLMKDCFDKALKEIKALREEQAAHFSAHDRTDERLAKLEKRCPPNSS